MRKETIDQITGFLESIDEFRVEKFVLFGSRVRGDHLKTSDLDIIVVSKDFESVNFPERPNLFYERWEGEPDLDFICYTPEEIARKMSYKGLVSTAMEEGIVVECRTGAPTAGKAAKRRRRAGMTQAAVAAGEGIGRPD